VSAPNKNNIFYNTDSFQIREMERNIQENYMKRFLRAFPCSFFCLSWVDGIWRCRSEMMVFYWGSFDQNLEWKIMYNLQHNSSICSLLPSPISRQIGMKFEMQIFHHIYPISGHTQQLQPEKKYFIFWIIDGFSTCSLMGLKILLILQPFLGITLEIGLFVLSDFF
jgi:hypothetical protein